MTIDTPSPEWDATRPLPANLPTRPVTQHPAADHVVELKLVVKGLKPMERQLFEGTVKLSQRRTPRLAILDEEHAPAADVVLIDSRDAAAMAWAQARPWLNDKAVIWIDAGDVPSRHLAARRPVQWTILPMLLARALEQGPGTAAVQRLAAAPAAPRSAAKGGRPILVVDDSLAARTHLRGLLEQRGFAVIEAESSEAALAVMAQQSFACVLMDVLMAGADGYEGCRSIKARFRGARAVPVVMLTSKSSPFDRIRGKMAGCDAYLTKPVDRKQLYEVLAQQIQAAADHPESASTAPAAAGFYPTSAIGSRNA